MGRASSCHNNWIWCAKHKKGPYAICGQRRPWSACANAQADLGLRCPLKEPMDTVLCRRTENVQVRLHGCTYWSEPTLSANCIRALFVRYASIMQHVKVKAPINRCVWSCPLHFADIFYNAQCFCKRTKKVLSSLCACAGWNEPLLYTCVVRILFSRHSSSWIDDNMLDV